MSAISTTFKNAVVIFKSLRNKNLNYVMEET